MVQLVGLALWSPLGLIGAWYFWCRLARMRVTDTADVLISHGYGRAKRFRWSTIDRVEPSANGALVYFTDGRQARLPALAVPPYVGHNTVAKDTSAFISSLNARHGRAGPSDCRPNDW